MQTFLQEQKLEGEMLDQWQTLIAAAEINPRRVKAVINDVELQWKMLVNSGQAEGVRRDDFIRWSALMRAAPENFKERVYKIDDLDLRLKFVGDALLWGGGQADENILRQFQEYQEDSYRLRSVLRQIEAFSQEFDGETLDAFLHLSAPPQKPEPKAAKPAVEKSVEEVQQVVPELEEVESEGAVAFQVESARERVLRGVEKGKPTDANRLEIGGLQFIKIPDGKFLMGSKDDNELAFDQEKPQRTVELPAFWMAQFPLTNEQYAQYLGEGKHPVEGWIQKKKHPVVYVSWDDAVAYCEWFNEQHKTELEGYGFTLHLPTEAQWEKAARGEYGNEWPWGNEFDKNRCNSIEGKEGGTTPVDAYPSGASPYGVLDMVGNVWEWTHTLWKGYPYKADDGREKEKESGSRVLRGGSFSYDPWVRPLCVSRLRPSRLP